MAGSVSSSPLASLPSECWLNILETLSSEDIRSLLVVSKRYSALALPFLYRDVDFDWRPIPVRRILLFLRAILQQPERASHIQHVTFLSYAKVDSLDPWEPPGCKTNCKEELQDFQDVLQRARAIVEDTQFPDTRVWIQALEDGNPYAFVSIILTRLHNLRSLRLDYSFIWQSGLPGLMLRHALFSSDQSTLSTFKHLTEVDYGGNVRLATRFNDYPEILNEDAYPLCNPDQFPAWFYLPSLQSLTIWLRTKQSLEMPGLRPNLAQLGRLILPRTTIEEDQVPKLLSLTTNLKTLHLGMAYKWGSEVSLQNGSAIIQGLKSISKTVTNLSFGVEYYPPSICVFELESGERDLTKPFYGLLPRFTALRSVEMPIQLLVGWDTKPWTNLASALPDTVERLCLRADYEPWDENGWHENEMLNLVGNNASQLRAHMPNLRRICVRKWKQFWSTRKIDQSREEARAACLQEGIDLQVVSDHLSTGVWTESRPSPERKVL